MTTDRFRHPSAGCCIVLRPASLAGFVHVQSEKLGMCTVQSCALTPCDPASCRCDDLRNLLWKREHPWNPDVTERRHQWVFTDGMRSVCSKCGSRATYAPGIGLVHDLDHTRGPRTCGQMRTVTLPRALAARTLRASAEHDLQLALDEHAAGSAPAVHALHRVQFAREWARLSHLADCDAAIVEWRSHKKI